MQLKTTTLFRWVAKVLDELEAEALETIDTRRPNKTLMKYGQQQQQNRWERCIPYQQRADQRQQIGVCVIHIEINIMILV